MAGDARPDAAATVDLEAYPIADAADPAYAALVERCRRDLDARRYCVLPGFVRSDALAAMVEEVTGLVGQAYANTSHRNCYLQREPDPALPPDHPRNIFFDASYRMIAADLFAETSLLKGLYHWPPVGRSVFADSYFLRFTSSTLQRPRAPAYPASMQSREEKPASSLGGNLSGCGGARSPTTTLRNPCSRAIF